MRKIILLGIAALLALGCPQVRAPEVPPDEQVTVTFNLGYSGAEGAPGPVTIDKDAALGDKFPEAPAREGYVFIGWFAGETEYTASTLIARDITLTARWELPPPPEADLFAGLALATPLKDYSHGNPLMTQNFGADPNVLVWEGESGESRVYVYMTGDTLRRNNSGDVITHRYEDIRLFRVLSSADLANWTHHPDLRRDDIVSGSWIGNTWAPALAQKEIDGRNTIFMYFSNGGGGTAVISADHPLGPWTSPRSNNIVTGSTQNLNNVGKNVGNPFDPGVLVDDDGRAYLYIGGATPSGGDAAQYTSNHPRPQNMRVFELQPDMYNLVDNTMRLLDVPFTFEASEINKINGKYYYSYSSNPQVTHYQTMPDDAPDNSGETPAQIRANALLTGETLSIAYAIGGSPMPNADGSGFVLTGMIMPNPSSMFAKPDGSPIPPNNNHHKMFQFRDQWYLIYHTKLLQVAWDEHIEPIDEDYNYRCAGIDEVTINADGTVKQVEGTREGVGQVSRFNPYVPVDGATMAVMAGINTAEYQPAGTSGVAARKMRVTAIDSGDWLALRGVDFGSAGASRFTCRVTPPANKGVIQIRLGGLSGRPVGYAVIEPGQSEIEADLLRTVTGVSDVVFVFYGSGYDFEEWQFAH